MSCLAERTVLWTALMGKGRSHTGGRQPMLNALREAFQVLE